MKEELEKSKTPETLLVNLLSYMAAIAMYVLAGVGLYNNTIRRKDLTEVVNLFSKCSLRCFIEHPVKFIVLSDLVPF